jgi:hypothetical protein
MEVKLKEKELLMAKSQITLFRIFGEALRTWSNTFRLVWQLFLKEPASDAKVN